MYIIVNGLIQGVWNAFQQEPLLIGPCLVIIFVGLVVGDTK